MPGLTTAFAQGLDADRPAAAAGNAGFHYFSTDTQVLYQSTGSAWVQIAAAGASGVGAVANAGNAPSLKVGLDSAKGAAGTAGRLYVSTDVPAVYEDSGSAWVLIATAAWATITGKPSTFAPSAHESSHLAAGSDPLAGVAQTQIDVDSTEAATNDSLGGGNLRTNLRRIRYQLAQLGTGAWNTLVAMVQLSPGSQQSGTINVDGQIQGADFKPGGLTGATAVSRWVGGTASGAPASGTFAVGDFVVDRSGQIWICTTAGSPGTWTQVSGSGGSVTSVGLSMPAEFSVASSPVTGSGTIAVTKANETANTVFGGPTSGGAAAPTFRSLVSADLPSAPTVSGEVTGSDFKPSGLTGATAASRLVGATASGAPGSGTFAVGDVVVDQSGTFYVCTGAGTPGTWVQVKGNPTFTGEVVATDFKPSGLTGATTQVRLVGGTASVAPTSGTFSTGDFVITQAGSIYICTAGGSPGTWAQVSGGSSLSVNTKGDLQTYSTAADRQAVGADGTFLGADSSTSTGLGWKYPAGIAGVSTLSSALSADVALTNANTYYDGPSLTLTAGTWLIVASADLYHATSAATVTAKLWDGTTVSCSGTQGLFTSGASASIPLEAIVFPTSTTTYKISTATNVAGGTLKAAAPANSAGNTATSLQAVQLTGAPASGPGALMPAVRAYNSGNISTSNATVTTLTFDTNIYDQGTSTSQHSTSSNTSRLVCQQAGVYHITANIEFAGNATGVREAYLVVNGTDYIATIRVPAASSGTTGLPISAYAKLSVGDYVEVQAVQSSGGTLNVVTGGHYSPAIGMARIDSGPGAVQPNTKVQLNYVGATDLFNGTTLSTDTWTNVDTAKTFNVDDSNSVVEVIVHGQVLVASYNAVTSSRIVIDGSVNYMWGGEAGDSSSRPWVNPLDGGSPIPIVGLAAGSHTIQLQVYCDATAGASGSNSNLIYCRPATYPNMEFLNIRVLERKQSSSPISVAPAPAVRCYNSANQSIPNVTATALTFDANRVDQGTSTPQHSTSSNTSRLVCQQAGMYQISASIVWAANTTGVRGIYFQVNGSTIIAAEQENATSASTMQQTISTLYQFAVGDYVEIYGYQSSGGALNVLSSGNFCAEFMWAKVDSGGQGFVPIPIVKTANATIAASESMVVAGANSLTLTLPAASSRAPGMPIVVKNDNFTSTTIARAGSDTIDGATSYSLSSAYASVTLVGDGVSVWRAI